MKNKKPARRSVKGLLKSEGGLKIAIIFKPYLPILMPLRGGMSNFVYFLSKGLVNQGHDVTVFASKTSRLAPKVKIDKSKQFEKKINIYEAGDFFYQKVEQKAKNLRDAVNMSFGELSERFDYKIENYLQMFSKVYAKNFDVVHIVTHDTLALYPALFSQTPAVISFHGHYKLLGPDYLRWLEYLKKEKPKKNCEFVSVSKYIQKEYLKFIGSKLIYNAIDITPYKLKKDKKDYIIYLGRIDNKKGVEFAIKFSQTYKIPLIIAAHITNQWYFEHVLKLHIDGRLIKFVKDVNEKEKNKLLGNAKCMIMPSRHKEAFGRVVVEALACGTPVIAFNNGAIPELVINNKTGFLIKEDDLAGAKKALDKIDQIKPEVCRKFVEQNFTLPRAVKEYEKLYRKVVK